MTRYAILTSGSCGNSYVFYDGKSGLLVDDGLTFSGLVRRLEQVEIPLQSITDVLVTHMHPDHSKGLGVLQRTLGVRIHASRQSFESDRKLYYRLGLTDEMVSLFDFGCSVSCEGFTAFPFRTSHDSAGSAGYRITCSGTSFFLMTDTGLYSEESLCHARQSDVLFLESNYDETMLMQGRYPYFLKQRIFGERGHLSNRQARDFLEQSGKLACPVYLVHLSENNNSPEKVKEVYSSAEYDNIVICERGKTYGGYDV